MIKATDRNGNIINVGDVVVTHEGATPRVVTDIQAVGDLFRVFFNMPGDVFVGNNTRFSRKLMRVAA